MEFTLTVVQKRADTTVIFLKQLEDLIYKCFEKNGLPTQDLYKELI